jgi:hypothetical protein
LQLQYVRLGDRATESERAHVFRADTLDLAHVEVWLDLFEGKRRSLVKERSEREVGAVSLRFV